MCAASALPHLRCHCAATSALPHLRCRICAATSALPHLRCHICAAASVPPRVCAAAGACEVATHEVSPGVFLSMQALPSGGQELRRVRFAKQMFSSGDAEQWWAANRGAVYANYNIVGPPHQHPAAAAAAAAGLGGAVRPSSRPAGCCRRNWGPAAV
ncbi:transcription factor regulating root and shoot growth via Pin3-domain-containing protein [Scenedesmus sp. NREL 46B-D3]|nr:transcription factor regulating root and shoot growth via Pin3-domain-containing protein [Scenedesmus sp. NREL 46B-D3]